MIPYVAGELIHDRMDRHHLLRSMLPLAVVGDESMGRVDRARGCDQIEDAVRHHVPEGVGLRSSNWNTPAVSPRLKMSSTVWSS